MRVPILMYHKIAPLNRATKIPAHYVEPHLFRRQMKILRSLKYDPAPLTSIFERSQNPRRVVITFDDGYENFYANALPVLEQFDFPSTVFLVSNQIGGTNDWDVRKGDAMERLMTRAQILDAANRRTEFGSHTADHVDLSSADLKEAIFQIDGSKRQLEDTLKLPIATFCYPYGKKNTDVEAIVAAAGYTMACSTEKGVNTIESNPMSLKRINVRRETSVPLFLYKLWRGIALGK